MRACLVFLFALLLAGSALAQKAPEQKPFLRIEAGMHTASIKSIGLSADGRLLATGSDDKTVRLWALPEGRLVRMLRLPIDAGNGGKVYAVALSPDGKTVAAGGWAADESDWVFLFDVNTGTLIRRLGPLSSGVNDLDFSHDGRKLVAGIGLNHGIRIWDVKTGKLLGQDTDYGDTADGTSFATNGQLAVASADGHIRLYNSKLARVARIKGLSGSRPYSVAFSPAANKLAVGYLDSTRVDILAASTLELQYSTDPIAGADADIANLANVAWSDDGRWLFAAGTYLANGRTWIFRWDAEGKGKRGEWPGPRDSVSDLLPLSGGRLAYGSLEPAFGFIEPSGLQRLIKLPVTVDMAKKVRTNFMTSADARKLRFGLNFGGSDPWLFSLDTLSLAPNTIPPSGLHEADLTSLPISDWENKLNPKLGTNALKLAKHDRSRSVAILPDKSGFLLGTNWSLHRFNPQGKELWKREAPGAAWGINLSADGRIAVVAYGDGTARWLRTKDGAELLTLFVHVPDKRWVLWTPSGYYAASPGGEDLVGWHLNGKSLGDPVDFFPASRFRDRFYRPDIVKLVLDTLDEREAVKRANASSGRKAESPFSRKILPPVISISADPRGLEAKDTELDLDYLLRAPSGRKVTKIEVRVDGRLFATETGEEFLKPSAGMARSLKVPLPKRDAEVSVVAFHDDQAGEPARIRVHYAGEPAPTSKTTLRALLVGVSTYRNTDIALNYADDDARDLARVLEQQEGKFFKSVETTVLLDTEATKANIEAALAELAAKTGPDDYAVVFLAGHGLTDKNRFYFIPTDAKVADGKLADAATGVQESEILKALSSMRGKVLFFIDACFSAAVMKVDATGFVNAITSQENAVMMYSSSQGEEVSFEDPEWSNGAFTEALMQIFADAKSYNANGEINTDELARKLTERVRRITKERQTPVGQSSRAIQPFPVMGL